ncbi:sulfated surface glycoprotein 185-like [Chenopodium quinoa]|uniref:sulfated surface glycoprotein 185-like n=1 Tax=Chenopodium quinoa TaxID=63459 RepID=UPI000B77C255|nr:sulfated surface glycoprotein 185-like [Chenopodium quinoa]
MFGFTESEVLKAQGSMTSPKGNNVQTHTLFSNLRANEQSVCEQSIRSNLIMLGSFPSPVTVGSPSQTGSPSSPLPRSPSSPLPSSPSAPLPRSPSAPLPRSPSSPLPRSPSSPLPRSPSAPLPRSPSAPPAGSPSAPPAGSPSAPPAGPQFSWKDVYNVHPQIKHVYHTGSKKKVIYNFIEAFDYLRFVRNVYAHINSLSQLNLKGRAALYQEVDKMWPGFVFALFVTLANMGLLLDGKF